MKMWMMQNRNQFYEPKISVYGRKSYRTANEDGIDARAVNGLECWIECFPNAHLAGTVFVGGVNSVGEIEVHSAL